MRISSFFYTIKQGIKNIFRNAVFSLASIATIASCLLLFGVFYAIIANFQNIVKTAEEGVAVTVFFTEDVCEDDVRMKEIGDLISARSEVSKVVFVSADQAWEEFKVDYLGEYAEGFTENPLAGSANYQIYLRDISQQDSLVSYLQTMTGIREVNYSKVTADALSGVNNMVSYVSIGIIGILLAVSIFLISNTVMIGISIRKEEIGIMKYIGATDFFVRAPFVVECLIIGLIGAAIPLGIINVVYDKVLTLVTQRFEVLNSILRFLPIQTINKTLIPISLGIGAGIGLFGSIITVRKHLKV
ncbi:MAG: permease-like cell division protein FtsX [Lachnospiraceae bacterium]|nr:permease-like cell division protein FtsX [Lachnospiraceae bacterium]